MGSEIVRLKKGDEINLVDLFCGCGGEKEEP